MSAPFCIQLCEKDDPKWLQLRTTGIGSSETPSLLGMGECDWQSALSIWTEKILGPAPWRDDAKLRAGRVLQPAIARLVELEIGGRAWEIEKLYRSTRYPWLTATPDFRFEHALYGDIMLETKNTTKVPEWNKERPHPRPWIQCQHQLLVMGEKVMILAGLVNGFDIKHFIVERDEKFLQKILIPETRKLWGMVRRNERPEADHSKASRDAILRLFPNAETITIESTELIDDADQELEEVEANWKRYGDERERLRNIIRLDMGRAERCMFPDGDEWTYTENCNGVRSLKRSPRKGAHS